MTGRFLWVDSSQFINQTISEFLRTPAIMAPLPIQDEVDSLREQGVHT